MVNPFRKIHDTVAQINPQLPGNSFLFQRTALTLLGMWAPLDNWNDCNNLLTSNPRYYRIFSWVLVVGFLYASIAFQVINLCLVTNIGDLAALAFLCSTQFVGTFKVQRFMTHYKEIRDLLETLNDMDFRPKDDVETKYVRRAIGRTFYVNLVLFLTCSSTLTQWIIITALSRTLVYDAWYPMDLAKTPWYVLVFGYQIVSAVANMVANTTLDIFIVGLIIHINSQVQRLNHRLTLVRVEFSLV
jgi:7tm Odorant receptor